MHVKVQLLAWFYVKAQRLAWFYIEAEPLAWFYVEAQPLSWFHVKLVLMKVFSQDGPWGGPQAHSKAGILLSGRK